jgi:hypothetical protein
MNTNADLIGISVLLANGQIYNIIGVTWDVLNQIPVFQAAPRYVSEPTADEIIGLPTLDGQAVLDFR